MQANLATPWRATAWGLSSQQRPGAYNTLHSAIAFPRPISHTIVYHNGVQRSVSHVPPSPTMGDCLTATTVLQDAETRLRAGDYAGSAGLIAPLATPPSPQPPALRLLGLCQLHLGNIAEAVACLAQAHRLAPDDLQVSVDYAAALHAAGRFADAVAALQPCLSLLPNDPAPLLHLSRSLAASGDAQGAIRAARKARSRGPGSAVAEFTLGMAYLAGDFAERAATCFTAAAKLKPDFADAFVNLGVAQQKAGKIQAAAHSMRKALAVDPRNVPATTNLALYLAIMGYPQASERLLRDLLAASPDATEARINLAANLLQEDRDEEVVALLEAAPPAKAATQQNWQVLLLLALVKLRRFEAARALAPAVAEVRPELQTKLRLARALLALNDGAPDAARQEAAAMTTLLGGSALRPQHRISGHYDLATVWSRLEDDDAAFANWSSAHRLLRQSEPFSRSAYQAFVDATIAGFSAERMRQGPRASNQDAAPVFIVGMPRSGTTLVEQILASHAAVHGAGERSALADLFVRVGKAPETAAAVQRVAALDGVALDRLAPAYLSSLHALAPAASRVTDKMPANVRHLGLAGLLLPGARVIACERDPRDIGLSIWSLHFMGAHSYAHTLADLGWYIGQQRRLMAHWRAVLPNPVLTVRHEALVADFPGVLREMLAFLELDYDPACERFYETERRIHTVSRGQVREGINARGVGRWRKYERHLEPLITALHEAGALEDG